MNKKLFYLFIALFLFSILTINVKAEPVCCEKTLSALTCQYVDSSECSADSKKAPTNCVFTSFCKVGTCFDLDDGRCYANMPLATCAARGETASFSDFSVENTPQCDVGCCIIGNQASLITQTRCKKETSNYPDLQMVFKEEVKDEAACVALARSSDKGCCVQSSDNCQYTARANCPLSTGTNLAGNGFFNGRYCSNQELSCDVTAKAKKGCLEGTDDVYYFDSAGNPEEIAENCDYVDKHNTCGKSGNDYKCVSLDCTAESDIFNMDAKKIISEGATIKNGEAWCEYDVNMDKFSGANRLIGFGRDVPGSRYYTGFCINNKIFVEPCKDFREEWCISDQYKLGSQTYNAAACRLNRWDDCTKQGFNAKNCEDTDKRDCAMTANGCVPFVPPGSKFWEDENNDVCSQANKNCEVIIKVPGLTKLLGEESGGKTGVGEIIRVFDLLMRGGGLLGEDGLAEEPTVIANDKCLKHTYTVAMNNLCRTQGDCGADVNILGDTKDLNLLRGFSITNGKDLDDIAKIAKGGGDPGPITATDLNNWFASGVPHDSADKVDAFNEITKNFYKSFYATTLVKGIYIPYVGGGLGVDPLQIGKVFIQQTFKPGLNLIGKGLSFVLPIGNFKISDWYTTKILDKILPNQVVSGFGLETPLNKLGSQELQDIAKKELSPEEFDKLFQVTGKDLTKKEFNGVEAIEALKSKGLENIPTQFGNIMKILDVASYIHLGLMVIDIAGTDMVTVDVQSTCSSWKAPTNSKDCAKCNPDDANAPDWRKDKVCSEYTCKSLGSSCVLLNEGTGNDTCVSQNPRDVTPPKISVWPDGLGIYKDKIASTPQGYKYNDIIPAFTLFPMAVKTDEPATCKASLNSSARFKDIDGYFGVSIYDYNHLVVGSIPNTYAMDQNGTLIPMPGQSYTLYIRCQDSLGNENLAPFTIRYTIQQGPDVTPPVVEGTNIIDGSYVQYGVNQTDIELYLNEPAECRWSQQDQDYNKMENKLTCKNTPNTFSLYPCTDTLKPVIDQIINKFYFRCKDQPKVEEKNRIVNEKSFTLTLRGSYPLELVSIAPSGTIYTRNFTLKVDTKKGATFDGKAYCYYGDTNDINYMNIFFKTNSSHHEQVLSPERSSRNYTFYVTCIDYGGNFVSNKTTITMLQDTEAPFVVSVYKDESYTPAHLTLILNEVADCQYKIGKDFTYGDGILMAADSVVQDAIYNEGATYYIKCMDASNNLMTHIFHA